MRPRVWPLALVAIVFSSAAARSCAEFLRYGPYPAGEPYADLFLACALVAGPALVLSSFRVWRRRQRDAWPSIDVSARIVAAGLVVTAAAGAAVMWMALYAPARWRSPPVGNALVAVSASGFIVTVGSAVMVAVGAARWIYGRRQAR